MKYSIIIPTYKHLEDCLKPCLESIKKHTNFRELHAFDDNVEIIVVANGCGDDGTREYCHRLLFSYDCPVNLIEIEEQLGYTKAVNIGIKEAKGDYIILLNNDTVLLSQEKSDWIKKLEAPFLTDPTVGITGPMKELCPQANRSFLIFFCVMISKKVFETVGYLDEAFAPAYGEDTDLCCKAEDAGFKIVQVPSEKKEYYDHNRALGDFPIYHAGNVSYRNWPDGDKLIEKNNNILRMRYNKDHINIDRALNCDGYMSPTELKWLGEKAKESKVFIEIGSWHGRSSRAIADNLPTDGKIYCVDTWKGSAAEPDNHASALMTDGDHAFIEFCTNLSDHIQSGKVIPVRMSSKNAAEFFRQQNIKGQTVFIDAGHTYPEVKEDISYWKDLVEDGGILCGHDYYHDGQVWAGVQQAVDEIFGQRGTGMGYLEDNSIWAHKINVVNIDKSIHEDLVRKKTTLVINEKPNVYDCFPFANELDILDIRFNELFDVVDRFVIVEATKTHGGESKPLNFQDNLKRYEKFLHKVTYIVVDDYPATDSWSIERHQRDQIMRGLKDCKDSDIIIMGDADEIPRAEVIKNYDPKNGLSCISQKLYYYYFNCQANGDWNWLRILSYSELKKMSPCQVRYTVNYDPAKQLIENGGWHFSYMGGTAMIMEKIRGTAHQEYNKPEFLIKDVIEERVKKAQDVFGRPLQYFYTSIDDSYPKYILDNIDYYRKNDFISDMDYINKSNAEPVYFSDYKDAKKSFPAELLKY